jgi:uncharacterized protein (DUF1499 family)
MVRWIAMGLLKSGLAASVLMLGVAASLLALAPLGSRLGWWHYGIGLYRLFPASGAVAAVSVALSFATIVSGRSRLTPLTRAALALNLVIAAGLVYGPLHYAQVRQSLPPINDISTDTANRPALHAVEAARAAERMDRTETPEPRLSQLQRAGYAEITPARTVLPVDAAFREALAVAQSMSGWTIVAVDAGAGRIEASQRSRWFGFTDDIVIRVSADAGGSRIDMRSASRKGTRDYGVNAARIRAYLGALKARIG